MWARWKDRLASAWLQIEPAIAAAGYTQGALYGTPFYLPEIEYRAAEQESGHDHISQAPDEG